MWRWPPRRRERPAALRPAHRRAAALGALGALGASAAFGAVGCSSEQAASGPRGPRLVACAAEPDRPLVWLDHDSDEPTGFTWELVETIVERADGTLRLRRSRPEDLAFDLLDRDCELIVSTLVATPEITEQIAVSEPYLEADLALAVRSLDTLVYPTVASLAGRPVGAVAGSAAETWLAANLPPGATLRTYPAVGDLVAALRKRDLDGVVAAAPALRHRAASEDSVSVTEVVPTGASLVVGIHPDDDELRELVDDGLAELRDDGTWERLVRRWFEPREG